MNVGVGKIQDSVPYLEAGATPLEGSPELLVFNFREPDGSGFGSWWRVREFVLEAVAEVAQIPVFRLHRYRREWKKDGDDGEY